MAPESAVVAAGVGATFHLLRLVCDLVAIATESAHEIDAKLNATKDDDVKNMNDEEKEQKQQRGLSRRFSTVHFDGRLSARNINTRESTTWSSDPRRRRSSLLSNMFSSKHSSTRGVNGDTENQIIEEEPKTWLERIMPMISFIIHLVLFAYFITATIFTSIPTLEQSRPEFANAMYDSIPLGCATTAVGFGLVLNIRDFHRKRFTSLQRGLYSISALILLLGCIVLIAFPTPLEVGGEGVVTAASSPTKVDFTTLGCLGWYALLAVVEGRIYPYPKIVAKEGKKAKLTMRTLLTILKPYFWPHATATSAAINRARAITTWLCVAAAKACSLSAPIYLGKALTALTRSNYQLTIRCAVYYCLLQLASMVFKECQSLVYLYVGQAAFVQLSEESFQHLHSLSLDWHLIKKLGEVIRCMDRGIAACDMLMKYLFLYMIPAIFECVMVTIIFATYFDDFSLAVAVFFFVFAYVVLTILLTLWRKKFQKKKAKTDNDWHDKCTDSLINYETVKFFTAEEYEKNRFGDAVRRFQTQNTNVQGSVSILNISQQVLLQACLATSLSLAAISIQKRMDCCMSSGCESSNSDCCSNSTVCTGLEVGDFVSVLTYVLTLFMPLNYLGMIYGMIVTSLIDLANLSEILAEKPDIVDIPNALDLPAKNVDDPDTVVEFDNVTFHYPTQPDTKGLKGLSFTMKKGTVTAIVGPTGEGKTTVSRLLFRFYDVVDGAVKINGVDVRAMKQLSLRGAIGVVPQNTSLFNDTLKNNIKYGRQDATDEEILQVFKDAQLQAFIDSLPEGWDTMVGDRGLKLSGGEKQRTAIARCLLKNPSIVVLDEATSALDTLTENSVQDALDRLGSDRTVLVIAHRLGTIRNADNIIVLGDGKVAEQGTHDELLERGGKYAEMWNMQLHSTRANMGSTVSLTGLATTEDEKKE